MNNVVCSKPRRPTINYAAGRIRRGTPLAASAAAPNPASDLCPRKIRPLVTSSPRVSACALCCNIATYRQFQFEFISCDIPKLLQSIIGINELINTYYRPSNNR